MNHRKQPLVCLCLCSVQLWFCRRALRPYPRLRKAGLKAAQALVQDPGEKPEPRLTVFSGHGRRGAAGGGVRDKEEHGREQLHQYFFYSLLSATQRACKHPQAGLMLPREKARKPERRHRNRHGCVGSLSPPATPLAEGLAGH